jgi:hypothetical protein
MAFLDIEQRHGSGSATATWRLDRHVLAAPVCAAGRDWLRLQEHPQAALGEEFSGWAPAGDREHLLLVELRPPGSRAAVWQGSVPRSELARIARRAALARCAAGIWPGRQRGDTIAYALRHGDGEPLAPNLRPGAPAAPPDAGALGIDWSPAAAPPAAPATADLARFRVHDEPMASADADIVVVFRPAVWRAIRAVCSESFTAGEERALLLHGARLRARTGSAFVPLFDIERVERPRLVEATATRLVLGHAPFGDGGLAGARGGAARGLLHTHLPGAGLEASDHDRRDIEDIDHGGPAAISVICEATAGAAPGFSIWGRIGRRGGHLARIDARVLVAEPAHRSPLEEPAR